MTGLPNRRAIDEWATRELSSAARNGFPVWVIVADLDRFKHINDTFGHNAGDEVLKKFSDILKTTRDAAIERTAWRRRISGRHDSCNPRWRRKELLNAFVWNSKRLSSLSTAAT